MASITRILLVVIHFVGHMPFPVHMTTDYLVKPGDEVTMTCSRDQGVTVIWDIEASGLVIAFDGELQGQAPDLYTLVVNGDTQVLTIASVTFDNGGIYRCYQFGSTDYVMFNVSVMVIPEHTLLLIPPTVVDQTFYPRCMAFASNPPAQMSWKLVYPDGREDFPSSYTSDTSHTNGTTTRSSFAVLTALSEMYGALLSCDVTITELDYTEQLNEVLYINVPPDSPYLVGLDPNKPVYAGNNHVIQCVANNGRPAAEITWTWDGSTINPDVTDIISNDNGTYDVISKVHINTLKPHHNEDYFECTVTSDALKETPEQFIYLNGTLIVYYPPQITVSMDSFDGIIFEGKPVNFECDIEAHPNVTSMGWLLDGDQISEDDNHIIDDNWLMPDLHIPSVTSEDKGDYQCEAGNNIGQTKSEKLNLVVFHKPVCKKHQMVRYGVSVGFAVEVECHTEAFPNTGLTFGWSTNSTEWITTPGIAYPDDVDYAMSNFTYRVSSESDFGEILCTAANGVGGMINPCAISIEHPGPASAPEICEATETGSDYIKLFCYEVFRGGSQPFYSLQVATNNLYFEEYFNKTSPFYEMYGLLPDTTYYIKVCASNRAFWRDMSCSDQFRLTTYNGTVEFNPEDPNPVAAYVPYIAAGVTLVLLLVILMISFICIQMICKKDKERDNERSESGSTGDADTGDVESIDLRLQSEILSSRRGSAGSASTSSGRSDCKLAKAVVGAAVVHSKVKDKRRGSDNSSFTGSSKSEGHTNPAYCDEDEEDADLYDQADGRKGTMRQSTIDTIIKDAAESGSEKSSNSGEGEIEDDIDSKSDTVDGKSVNSETADAKSADSDNEDAKSDTSHTKPSKSDAEDGMSAKSVTDDANLDTSDAKSDTDSK